MMGIWLTGLVVLLFIRESASHLALLWHERLCGNPPLLLAFAPMLECPSTLACLSHPIGCQPLRQACQFCVFGSKLPIFTVELELG